MTNLKKMLLIEYADCPIPYTIDSQNKIGRELLDTLTICPLDRDEKNFDVPVLIREGILPNNVFAGQVFMRSPYDDDKYIRLEDYEMTVMQDKADYIAEIARQLGATRCKYDIQLTSMVERNLAVNVKGQYNAVVDADVAVKKAEQERLSASIKVGQEYPQAKVPTTEDYNKAVAFAKEHHLYTDVKTLLMSRSPQTNNLLSRKTVSVILSNETNADLNVATNLNVLGNTVSIGVNFQKSMKYERQVIMNLEYEFAMPL